MSNDLLRPKRKITRAKSLSKIGMILGATIIILYNLFSLINNGKIPTSDEQDSIIKCGVAVAAMFSPMIIAIIIDTIKKKTGV